MNKIADTTIKLIGFFEGCKLTAYKLEGDCWTIGYGHTGAEVHEGMKITQLQAEKYLRQDLKERVNFINKCFNDIEFTQNQFDAILSFVYNRGSGNFLKSNLYKQLKAGNFQESAEAFLDDENWNFSKFPKNIRYSLKKRREKEREIFLTSYA